MKAFNDSGSQRKRKTDKKELKAATWGRSSMPPHGNCKKKWNKNWELQFEHRIRWSEPGKHQPSVSRESNIQKYQKKKRGLTNNQLFLIPKFIADGSSTDQGCPICLKTYKIVNCK